MSQAQLPRYAPGRLMVGLSPWSILHSARNNSEIQNPRLSLIPHAIIAIARTNPCCCKLRSVLVLVAPSHIFSFHSVLIIGAFFQVGVIRTFATSGAHSDFPGGLMISRRCLQLTSRAARLQFRRYSGATRLERAQQVIGYRFSNPELLKEALQGAGSPNTSITPEGNRQLALVGDKLLSFHLALIGRVLGERTGKWIACWQITVS